MEIPIIEFLKDRLYLGAFDYEPEDDDRYFYFTVDDCLLYNAFHHDFGPFHVGHLYRFAVMLHDCLSHDSVTDKAIVFYSRTDPKSRANAACVLCCYMVLIQSWPPHLALAPICQVNPPFMPFRDAGYSVADFEITIQDTVYGVWRAKEKGLLDLRKFNLEDYELYESVEMGDFNVITPNFIAFASPQSSDADSQLPLPFSMVLDYFKSHDVGMVFRLNSELYNKREFERRGIKHIDMMFEDGTCPPLDIVRKFIGVCDSLIAEGKMIAVHCKAGLGRTGCLIGAHLIYTYGFTAQECIAFMRFMRPGMVVGPQQHWLYMNQNEFREWKMTMSLGARDPELRGYSSLVPRKLAQQEHLSSQPQTPVRHILGDRSFTNTPPPQDTGSQPLPAPTPGQPRKSPNRVISSVQESARNLERVLSQGHSGNDADTTEELSNDENSYPITVGKNITVDTTYTEETDILVVHKTRSTSTSVSNGRRAASTVSVSPARVSPRRSSRRVGSNGSDSGYAGLVSPAKHGGVRKVSTPRVRRIVTDS
ncbi:hypothetical protein CANCADRAFT_29909 [Tortispora caseinolytica NRRL Y-17796]|uniref:Tyrosine-protein phosphatase CDC14 n=1 Tax=Tortispora caseinolytica NRRL Y-17796 TaxID=767744 RepID=A0A1E4TIB4_9ASCO|nr:hypothetical protein CANCADRAFT_29909 [Tortispora caseinolytica NRRL Y-17796]